MEKTFGEMTIKEVVEQVERGNKEIIQYINDRAKDNRYYYYAVPQVFKYIVSKELRLSTNNKLSYYTKKKENLIDESYNFLSLFKTDYFGDNSQQSTEIVPYYGTSSYEKIFSMYSSFTTKDPQKTPVSEITIKQYYDYYKGIPKKLSQKRSGEDKIAVFLETLISDNNEKFKLKGDNKMLIKDLEDLIENGNCKQVILTGAPGTGKTYIAKEIAKKIGGGQSWNGGAKYELVQFHPSYDYTDFVEGIRPIEKDGEKEIQFAKLDGIFKKFCRNVINEGNNEKYFFIIDEINRADLSKVFGELMYCLEKDKRGKENRVKTQYQNLPTYDVEKKGSDNVDCFESGFYIPENVIIIGTMNDIDRSVESMDFALRRRFEWIEVEVKSEMLEEAFQSVDDEGEPVFGDLISKNAKVIADRVAALNNYIEDEGKSKGLNKQYFISQGYFANIEKRFDGKNDEEKLEKLFNYIWNYRIKSLLKEYLRGENGADEFIDNCRKKFLCEGGSVELQDRQLDSITNN